MKKCKLGFLVLNAALYIGCIAYGIVNLVLNQGQSQMMLVIVQGVQALFFIFLPQILTKIFKLKFSFLSNVMIAIYVFLAVFLGETFEFYYHIWWWDIVMHLLSGVMIVLFGIALANAIFNKHNDISRVFLVMFAIFMTLSLGLLWEIVEFVIDSCLGTNMQKFIPEYLPFFNQGNSFGFLNGTIEEIGEFYRTPEGYKYALMDTMQDLICDFLGAWIGTIIFIILEFTKSYNIKKLVYIN